MMTQEEMDLRIYILKQKYKEYKDNKISKDHYYSLINDFIREAREVNISSCEKMFKDQMFLADFNFIVELSTNELLSKKGFPLRVDFLLIDPKDDTRFFAAVEIDGPGHYKENDDIKNKYFEDLNIPLLRFNLNDLQNNCYVENVVRSI